jgi:hypothetical protein
MCWTGAAEQRFTWMPVLLGGPVNTVVRHLSAKGMQTMSDDFVYDNAEWHWSGDYPEGLPQENAFTHTGMFLGWIIDHDLYSDFFRTELKALITAFKDRQKTGAQVYEECDGMLANELLNDEGNAFAREYFDFDSGQFIADYDELLVMKLPSLYHVEDTWENYARLKARIDRRYAEWKQLRGRS